LPRHKKANMGSRAWLRYVISLGVLLLASCGGGGGYGAGGTMAPPSGLSYPPMPTLFVGKAIAPLSPTVTGTVSTYSVTALPAGLSLDAGSGVISGTPTTASPMANYTVTAANSGGSTTAMIAITVDVAPPSISYGSSVFTLTTGAPVQSLVPTNSGGAAASWSLSPPLPSSLGLIFNSANGSISGTPTATAAPASYRVTAQNSSGMSTASFTLGVQTVLLDLGHSQQIVTLRVTASRVASLDVTNHWVLWDYASDANIASGPTTCKSAACVAGTQAPVDLEATTVVAEGTAGLEVHSSSDGSLVTVITTPVSWWKLASDGSYVCGGSATALTIWSRSGTVIATRAGDYSKAVASAAPTQVQVALGPAGANVIETVSVPSGSSSVSPAFQGTFSSWFLDGQQFLTTTGNTVRVYTSSVAQQDLRALPSVENLTGQGSWFWEFSSNGNLNIYKVGASASPAASYAFGCCLTAFASGPTIAVGSTLGPEALSVIDLSGSSPTRVDTSGVLPYLSAYAAVSGSQWLAGNLWGAILDGASLGGTRRYLGYGAAFSIAGSSQRAAIATASGRILYFDATTSTQEGTITFASSQLAMSSDGSVLAAAADQNGGIDRSINIYSLPSGTLSHSWPYTVIDPTPQGEVLPFEISLSGSGTVLGQVLATFNSQGGGGVSCSRQVTAANGGPVLWSDTFMTGANPFLTACAGLPVRLSPDGSGVAVSNNLSATSGTNIYSNGTLVTAVPGWVVGWLDNNRILVNNYMMMNGAMPQYLSSAIYSSTGAKLAAPALPQLLSLDVVSADSVYDPGSNAIYSTTTGMTIWSSASATLRVGAIAGANVVFASGSQVLVQPY
jgi:hypothetical protein